MTRIVMDSYFHVVTRRAWKVGSVNALVRDTVTIAHFRLGP